MKQALKSIIRSALPLRLRRPLAVWVNKQAWLRSSTWWSLELLADWVNSDPVAYHKFLWANHLGYAESYEIQKRFGPTNIHRSRILLFDELLTYVETNVDMDPADIQSIFEVGCSLGYLLNHIETNVFPGARTLHGVDIDRYAIEKGTTHLSRIGSKAKIDALDMEDLAIYLGRIKYDVTLIPGVLMYLTQNKAEEVLATLLEHTRKLIVIAGLAHPSIDNCNLEHSEVRGSDGSFIHNLDRMVEAAGGRIVYRRWDGSRDLDGNTIYFIFAEPSCE